MTPHKHAAVIKAWADGAQIERRTGDLWVPMPSIHSTLYDCEYRIKPTTTDEQADDSTGIVEVSE